jgi:hypothetical protein
MSHTKNQKDSLWLTPIRPKHKQTAASSNIRRFPTTSEIPPVRNVATTKPIYALKKNVPP